MNIEIAEMQHELEMERLDRTFKALDMVALNVSIEVAEFLAGELGLLKQWEVYHEPF